MSLMVSEVKRMRQMVRGCVYVICGVVASVALAADPVASPSKSMPAPVSTESALDSMVAIVNDGVITSSEVQRATAQATAHAEASKMQLPDATTLNQIVLNQLISRKLQLQVAARAKTTASDEEVAQALSSMAKQQRITVTQLLAQAKQQGFTSKEFKHEISDEIILHKVQQAALGQDIQVTQADIDKLKEQVRSQQKSTLQYHYMDFIVALPDTPTATQSSEAFKVARSVYDQLKSGSKQLQFAGARTNDAGWTAVSDIPEVFVVQLAKMQVGQVAVPIQTGNGYHVIKMLGKKGQAAKLPSDEQLQQMVYQQKMAQAVTGWVKTLRAQSYVKIVSE